MLADVQTRSGPCGDKNFYWLARKFDESCVMRGRGDQSHSQTISPPPDVMMISSL